jgi:hypothetical protein
LHLGQTHASAQADLGEDSLTGEQFGGQADDKAEHGQTTIPGFSKRNESEAGSGISHGSVEKCLHNPNSL